MMDGGMGCYQGEHVSMSASFIHTLTGQWHTRTWAAVTQTSRASFPAPAPLPKICDMLSSLIPPLFGALPLTPLTYPPLYTTAPRYIHTATHTSKRAGTGIHTQPGNCRQTPRAHHTQVLMKTLSRVRFHTSVLPLKIISQPPTTFFRGANYIKMSL